MGKYIKKSKGTGDVAVMEVSQSCLGVRTRAKTLALQQKDRLQKTVSYLQLRSRRLEKPLPVVSHPQKMTAVAATDAGQNRSEMSNSVDCSEKRRVRSGNTTPKSASETASRCCSESLPAAAMLDSPSRMKIGSGHTPEPSFGENLLDCEARESSRSMRETTPCSLMRNSEMLDTPGSTTRQTNLNECNRQVIRTEEARRNIPTSNEIEEFFAGLEKQDQKRFAEKYNFDPVNELPLPGRYEWMRMNNP